jgi:hypothetical protein
MTGFNEEELLKIEKATSGLFKGKARSLVATALRELRPKIRAMKQLSEPAQSEELKRLVKNATAARHLALSRGASSYGSADWAAAAACETWLQSLALDGDEDIGKVEVVVLRLIKRG